MVAAGLVAESEERPAAGNDDERRRYYEMTPLGRRVVRAEAERLDKCRHRRQIPAPADIRSESMNTLELIYRALLFTYPRSFRLHYGREMQRVFREQYAAIAKSGSHLAKIRFVWQTAADWLESAGREWLGVAWGPVREWSTTILLYLFVTTTLVQAYVIPTGSMEGNLRVGDHMLVDKTSQYRDVKRGDIRGVQISCRPASDLRKARHRSAGRSHSHGR